MSSRDDKAAEFLRCVLKRTGTGADRIACPDEQTLAGFLSGELRDPAQSHVEAHLAACSFCLEELVAVYKSGAGYEIVPERVVQKAIALVEREEPVFDLAVRFVRDAIELISTSASVIPMTVPATRNLARPSQASALHVEQELGRFRIAVELEIGQSGTCQLTANVTEWTGAPAEGLRLSLKSGDREQASFLTRGGIVVFDRISPGEYSIAVSESGTYVGRIKVSLTM